MKSTHTPTQSSSRGACAGTARCRARARSARSASPISSRSIPTHSATYRRRGHAAPAAGHPALQPVPGAGADVVPLEALRVPAALDGSAGLNRAPVPAHQAELAEAAHAAAA